MSDEADRGRAIRYIIDAEGWTGPNDPTAFARAHTADVAELMAMIAEVRQDERRRVAKHLSDEANRIFNAQDKDYPSNVLDKVSLALRCDEPFKLGRDSSPAKGGGT